MAEGLSQWLDTISGQMSFDQLAGKYTVSVTGIDADGIDGFKFTQMRDYEVSLSSSITDYPVEDGNVAQNVITLMPERLKLTGVAAEISYGEDFITHTLETLSASLIPVSALLPSISIMTQNIKSQLEAHLGELKLVTNELQKFLPAVQAAAAAFGDTSPAGRTYTIQEKAYYYLELCWKSRKLLNVETPWRYFDNMAIEDVKLTQDATTKYVSNIEVSFKRIIQPQSRQKEQTKVRQGRAQSAIDEVIDIGKKGLSKMAGAAGDIIAEAASVIGVQLKDSTATVTDIVTNRGGLE